MDIVGVIVVVVVVVVVVVTVTAAVVTGEQLFTRCQATR